MIIMPPLDVLIILSKNPGQMYIAPGGKELYVSDPTSSAVVLFTGPNFGAMNDAEINQYVVEQALLNHQN